MLALLLLAGATSAPGGDEELQVRAWPRMTLGPAPVTVSATINGPITEKNYCLGFVIVWPDSSESSNIQDCPPLAEYEKTWQRYSECMAGDPEPAQQQKCGTAPFSLDRGFSRTRGFPRGGGQYQVTVKFVRSTGGRGAYKVVAQRGVTFTVN